PTDRAACRGPPVSMNVPTNTRSNATLGDEVMPLNDVLASNRVSHNSAPSVSFNRTTVPLDVPTYTELLKTAGEENPFALDVFQSTGPFPASSAKVQPIVVAKTFPEATAAVEAISGFPASLSLSVRTRSEAVVLARA